MRHGKLCWNVVILLGLASCGGGDAGVPDGGTPGGADASTPAPAVSAVAVAGRGASTQLRQGEAGVDIVVTGTGLAGVTAATLGDMTATISSATGTTVHLAVTVPHGETVGSKTLTVTAPRGTAMLTAAATVTPISVAMTGNDTTGFGTAEVPWRTIRKGLDNAAAGDVVHASDGTYLIGEMLDTGPLLVGAGVRLEGQSMAATIVTSDPGGGATGASGVSVAGVLSTIRVSKFITSCVTMSGTASLDHVQADGCNYGFYSTATGTFTLDHARATANRFNGISLAPAAGSTTATVTSSELDANGSGSVAVSNGGLSVTGAVTLTMDGCNIHNNVATASGIVAHVSGSVTVRNTTATGSAYGFFVQGSTYVATQLDLGTSATSGANALGGSTYAIWDHRPALGSANGTVITLTGTTLNGTSYAAQTITGAATNMTDYFVDGTFQRIQF